MSMYNIVNGVNAELAVYVSLILNQDITKTFPRFRDVFTNDDECPVKEYNFLIYTRMGGGNRECWEEGKDLCECPACSADDLENKDYVIARYDDSFDSTYCTFVIKLSEEEIELTPEVKKERLKILFPKLYEKMEDN